LGRISKRGNKYLRTLFIQAANVIMMRPQNWEKFSFGPWLVDASKRLHRNKLATALANKLARIAWSVLRNEHHFDENRYAVVSRAAKSGRSWMMFGRPRSPPRRQRSPPSRVASEFLRRTVLKKTRRSDI
jgi:hypothetical protein